MGKDERKGNRKTREQTKKLKPPELGYYLVVTDTEGTEKCYFDGLSQSLPEDIKKKLVIKVVETKTCELIDKCLELTAYESQYRMPWIIFDRDQVMDFDEIIEEAKSKNINVGWSNACFEIWLYAYFGIMPAIRESWRCCSSFGAMYKRKTGQPHLKVDRDMYNKLNKNGNEEKAIQVAKRKLQQCLRDGKVKPSEMYPCTTVYKLVEEINRKRL